MTKAARREKNQKIAQYMKDHKIERTQGRCPVCYRLVHADYLNRGMAGHRCDTRREDNSSK